MSGLVRIAKGLKSSFKNARDYTIDQALCEVEKYTDNYEVLNADFNRVYGDIDGKNIEGTEDEFNKKDQETRLAIERFLGDAPYCLMTASSHLHKKISWRFVLTSIKSSLEDNKKWVQSNIENIHLPEGITFDTAPYGKNQKIRMIGSNKDGENRPLRLIKGDKLDTLISYIPDGCELKEMPKEKKVRKQKKETEDVMPGKLLERIVMNITNNEDTTWDQWYKVAQAIYNEKGTEDLFLAWSSKSPKHNEREAMMQWKSLKLGENTKLTAGSLYYWSQQSNSVEHEKIILECCSPDDYQYQKIEFEKTHFKLNNPPCFVRQHDTDFQMLKEGDLHLMYQNKYCGEDLFITKWKADPTTRTYEKIVFKPKQYVSPEYYNIFTGFSTQPVEGDVSVVLELFWLLSGKNEEVYEYVLNYFAHLIQKPYEKAKICLVFQSNKQGAGKDTPLDFIGRMLGSGYYFNTEDAENNVFGRFTSHLQKCLLLKMEEVEFETNKKNESALLSLITAPTRSYEAKGKESVVLDDYKRIVMTTNKSVPVNVPDSDRRFVLIHSSEDRVGDFKYWEMVYDTLAKPETASAFLYFLENRDISKFSLMNRPITDFYKEVKTTLRPYHSVFFQGWIQRHEEGEYSYKATELLSKINEGSKYSVSATKLGKDLATYPETAISKIKGRFSNTYTIHIEGLYEYLVSKGWWDDL